jgi:hypothetical protein
VFNYLFAFLSFSLHALDCLSDVYHQFFQRKT